MPGTTGERNKAKKAFGLGKDIRRLLAGTNELTLLPENPELGGTELRAIRKVSKGN